MTKNTTQRLHELAALCDAEPLLPADDLVSTLREAATKIGRFEAALNNILGVYAHDLNCTVHALRDIAAKALECA